MEPPLLPHRPPRRPYARRPGLRRPLCPRLGGRLPRFCRRPAVRRPRRQRRHHRRRRLPPPGWRARRSVNPLAFSIPEAAKLLGTSKSLASELAARGELRTRAFSQLRGSQQTAEAQPGRHPALAADATRRSAYHSHAESVLITRKSVTAKAALAVGARESTTSFRGGSRVGVIGRVERTPDHDRVSVEEVVHPAAIASAWVNRTGDRPPPLRAGRRGCGRPGSGRWRPGPSGPPRR